MDGVGNASTPTLANCRGHAVESKDGENFREHTRDLPASLHGCREIYNSLRRRSYELRFKSRSRAKLESVHHLQLQDDTAEPVDLDVIRPRCNPLYQARIKLESSYINPEVTCAVTVCINGSPEINKGSTKSMSGEQPWTTASNLVTHL